MAPLPLVLAASLGTMLLAAKAHGRQVRVEREREGYRSVAFGGENPAFVEALWRADRARFWITAGVALLALAAWRFVRGPAWGFDALALPLWALTAGFVVAGLLSRRRLARRGGRDAWGWWIAVAAAAVATAGLALA